MRQSLFISTAIAAGLFAAQMHPATAAPTAPALSPERAQTALVEKAGWRCGPRRCTWAPNYWGPVPGYARGWRAPHAPGCYWKRGVLGNWKYKCDDDWD